MASGTRISGAEWAGTKSPGVVTEDGCRGRSTRESLLILRLGRTKGGEAEILRVRAARNLMNTYDFFFCLLTSHQEACMRPEEGYSRFNPHIVETSGDQRCPSITRVPMQEADKSMPLQSVK